MEFEVVGGLGGSRPGEGAGSGCSVAVSGSVVRSISG